METLFPFRGFRYDPAQAGPLDRLVTQPYDKITPEMLERYRSSSPLNISRVIKNPNYDEAGRLFADWIGSGVLGQDPEPCYYPYQQEFDFEGERVSRLGFVALVPLEHPGLAVKGHERIHEAPLQDRLQLIRRTESNDGLIFSLFSDPSQTVDALLARHAREHSAVAEVTDEYGAVHRLWRLSDPAAQSRIAKAFEGLSLYIADGHHRFQTALLYASECRQKGWRPAAVESFDKRMMALFNMEAPGLKILPTHRAIRDLSSFQPEKLLEDLEAFFETTPKATLDELLASMQGEGHRLGLATGRPARFYLLRARARQAASFMPGVRGSARELDVNILHEGILHPFLGIGEKELARQSHADYFRDRGEMIRALEEGQYQAAFLLNPTRLDQVRQISEEGRKMPQKSTDFFPKLLTGLVFMKMVMER